MKFIVLLLFPITAIAQFPQIELTSRHIENLNHLEGEKRLTRYLKYYKTDSIRQTKRFLSVFADSIELAPLSFDSLVSAYSHDNAFVNQAHDELLPSFKLKSLESKVPTKSPHLNSHELSPELLKTTQQSMSKIFSKYRVFANSSDLTHAIRQTSLKGRTFRERLVLAFNFDMKSVEPFAIGISPTAGYKFNTRFQTGVGLDFVLGRDVRDNRILEAGGIGYKWFTNYDVLKSFFVIAEVAWASVSPGDELASRKWGRSINIGLGKKMLIHPKLYFTVTGLYDLFTNHGGAFHPDRFSIRFGFQSSELANRKLRPVYDPNK
jgi:hypothetical protein